MPMPDGATGHHNINADPEFVDAANYDFSLSETSPCIDAGVASLDAGGITLIDLDPSQYNGAAPDIGALEYLGIFADGFESGNTTAWTTTSP